MDKESRLKRLACLTPGLCAWAVLILALAIPAGVTAPTPGPTLLAGGVLAILTALCLPWAPMPAWPVALLSLSLLGWCLACSRQSLAPHLSLVFDTSLVGFSAVLIAVQVALRRRSDWLRGVSALVLTACAICAYGLVVMGPGRLQATFTNPDCFSVIPLTGATLSLGLASASARQRPLWMGCTTFLSICLVLTGARAGLIGFGVAYLVFLGTLLVSDSKTSKALIPLYLIPPLLGLLLLFALGSGFSSFDRWLTLGNFNDRLNFRSRLDVTLFAPRSFLRRPLWGAGPGCFHLAYQQDRPGTSQGEAYMNVAHDDYLQWLVETGAPGLVLWLALLAGCLATSWRAYRRPPGLVGASLGCAVGVAVYELLNFLTPVPADLYWLGATLGLCAALGKAGSARWPALLAGPLLIAGLWSAQQGWQFVQVGQLRQQAGGLEEQLDWESAYAALSRAQAHTPLDPSLAVDKAQLAHKAAFFLGDVGWLKREQQDLSQARQASPRDLFVLQCYASALERRQQFQAAFEVLREAHEFAPYNALVRRALAKNMILRGDLDGAARETLSLSEAGEDEGRILSDLLVVVEYQKPGQGKAMLQRLLGSRRDFALRVGLDSARTAQRSRQSRIAASFMAFVEAAKPDQLAILLDLAEIYGLTGDTAHQVEILDSLRRKASVHGQDELTVDRAWQSWCAVQLKAGDTALVARQLDDYLIRRPRETWARFSLSAALERLGRASEARAALRNGLPYDTDGSVRVALGDLYHRQHLDDIARGYYQDALPLVRDPNPVKARMDQLKSAVNGTEDGSTIPVDGF